MKNPELKPGDYIRITRGWCKGCVLQFTDQSMTLTCGIRTLPVIAPVLKCNTKCFVDKFVNYELLSPEEAMAFRLSS